MALDKKFYREQAMWSKQRLEKIYKLIDLNPIQIQSIREEVDKLVEANVNIVIAPEFNQSETGE